MTSNINSHINNHSNHNNHNNHNNQSNLNPSHTSSEPKKATVRLNDIQKELFKCEVCDEHLKLRLKELSQLLKLLLMYIDLAFKKQIEGNNSNNISTNFSNKMPSMRNNMIVAIENLKILWGLINKLIVIRKNLRDIDSNENHGALIINQNFTNNPSINKFINLNIEMETTQEDLKIYSIEARNRRLLLQEHDKLLTKFIELENKIKDYLEEYYIEKNN